MLRDVWMPSSQCYFTGPLWPSFEAENFEPKPGLIALVQQQQFGGLLTEDPYEHLYRVMEYSGTVRYHGVPQDAIKCMMFSFSLMMMLVLGIDPCHQGHTVGMRYHELSWIDISHYTSSLRFEMRSSISFSVNTRACMMHGRDTRLYSGDVLTTGLRDG